MKKFLTDNLPAQFVENVIGVCGKRGQKWLSDLPEIVGKIAEKWTLKVENPFPNLSYNYVAPCVSRADGSRAVLKIGLPEDDDSVSASEADYLGLMGGNGSVKLLRFDPNNRALLLERLMPGDDLKQMCAADDERATRVAVEILRRIKRAPPLENKFPTLEKWVENFQKFVPADYADFIGKAQNYFAELIAASKENLVLHGDFHHQNILSAERESFLVIDPKGIVGDIGFEISVFLNNPRGWLLSHPNARAISERRIEIFAEAFAVAPSDLRKWAYAEAVLSAWWTIEDGGADAGKWLACTAIWES